MFLVIRSQRPALFQSRVFGMIPSRQCHSVFRSGSHYGQVAFSEIKSVVVLNLWAYSAFSNLKARVAGVGGR